MLHYYALDIQSKRKSLWFIRKKTFYNDSGKYKILHETLLSFCSNKTFIMFDLFHDGYSKLPLKTQKGSFHYYKSFPSIFQYTHPLIPAVISLIDLQSKLRSLGSQCLQTHANEHSLARITIKGKTYVFQRYLYGHEIIEKFGSFRI